MDVRMLAESSDLTTSAAFLAAIVAATTILLITIRHRSSSGAARGLPRNTLRSPRFSNQASDEMRQLLIELQAFARETIAQIDNRTRKLELLIRDADARLARLEEIGLDEAKAGHEADDSNSSSPGVLDILVDDGGPTAHAPDRTKSGAAISALRRQVYELADQGKGALEIARTIDRPTGEIELMLSLRTEAGVRSD